ncbi:MAG: hypothetical protein J0I06_14800 [Planctomycetes bacterium]|nr:hypothetical protein [Planctomycetota bacterium]
MFAVLVGCSFCLPAVGPQMVRPGMSYPVAGALIGEKPTVLNQTGNRIREVEYPRTGIRLTLDDKGVVVRVNGEGEETSAEKELERIAKALPEGFKRSGFIPLLKPGEKPGTDEPTKYGYARLRIARMTSDTTAKITISFYGKGKDGEEEYGAAFIHLSWYHGCWTVTKYEGWDGTRTHDWQKERFIAYIDEISDNRPKR